MSQLTDMQTAIAALQTDLKSANGVTTDQVNTIVSQSLSPLQSSISQILASEQTDEAKLADVSAAISAFTAAFAPAAPAQPVADSTPASPAPTPSPAADSTPVTPTPAPDATPTPAPAPATAS